MQTSQAIPTSTRRVSAQKIENIASTSSSKELLWRDGPAEQSPRRRALSLVQARQLYNLHYNLQHHLQISQEYRISNRLNRLEKTMLDIPLALLEKMSLDERFNNLEILVLRFAWDCQLYAIGDQLVEESQEYFTDLEAMKGKMVSFMTQIRTQIEILSGIVQKDSSEDSDSKNGDSREEDFDNGSSSLEDRSNLGLDSIYSAERWKLVENEANSVLRSAARLEAAAPMEDRASIGTSLEERLRFLADNYTYSKWTWRQALDPYSQHESIRIPERSEWINSDEDNDIFLRRWIEAGMSEYDQDTQDRISQALDSVLVDDIPESERQCSICREAYESSSSNAGEDSVKLQCGHIFGMDCVKRWIIGLSITTCPLCRREVLPDLSRRRN